MKHKQLISRLKDIETYQARDYAGTSETINEAIKEIKRLKKKVKKWKMLYLTSTER